MSNLAHFYKTVNNFWTKLDIKNRYKVLERRQLKGNVPNFKTNALAARKLKGKENCENEHRETASLCTTLYRKPMQPSNFDGILYLLRHWIFSHSFHQKIRSTRYFKKRPKSDFRQKSNFYPYSDALNSPLATLWKDFEFLKVFILKGKKWRPQQRIRKRASLDREPLAQESWVYPPEPSATRRKQVERKH